AVAAPVDTSANISSRAYRELIEAIPDPVVVYAPEGAALYINGTLSASWSPAGLAFKLPEQEVEALIASGEAKPLKYFAKGYIKKGYVLFENPERAETTKWKEYFLNAAKYV
ncbi:hypothetical protein MJD09_03255, partial [bacterium]|nr:hypothetical protein [bacterium]